MSDYRLQMYTQDLHGQVCELQKHLWGSSIRLNAAYLDWKHLSNPYIEEPLIYVALYDGRVVGMRAMYGTCWEAGDYTDKTVLPCAADTVIEPHHRDSSLFQKLTNYVMDDLSTRGYSYALNFTPSAANYVVSVLTMGWRPMGSSETLTRQISSNSVVAKMIDSTSRFKIARKVQGVSRTIGRKVRTAMHINAFADLDRNARTHGHPVSLSREPRPEAMADLVQRLGGDGRLRHVRNHDFFSWRFGNPRASYRFLFWGDEDPGGYMVLQNTAGQAHVNIVDWEGRDPEVRSDILEAAMNWGHFRNLSTWGATLSDSVIEMLQKAGFSPANTTADSLNRAGQFLLKPLGPDAGSENLLGRQPLEHDNWDLRMIYSDGE